MASGRPARQHRIDVRLSTEERLAIEAAAIRTGLTLSGYIRAAVLGVRPLRSARRPPVEVVLLTQVLVRLGAIAFALRLASGTAILESDTLPPIFGREIARALTDLRHCRQKIMMALGRKALAP